MNSKLLVIILLIVILLGGGYFLYSKGKNSTTPAPSSSNTPSTISGKIDLDGVVPSGATISISERSVGSSQFNTVVTGVNAADNATWSWTGAQKGTAYELQANVIANGQTVEQSSVVTDVAPSNAAVLRIVTTHVPPSPSPATISGVFDLNGYIPTGSIIAISARKSGDANFAVVANNLAAKDNGSWSWTGALSGQAYDVQAAIIQNSNTVAQSAVQSITAPAGGETITIDSKATPPKPATVSLSGTITINGSIPGGATVSIGVRPTGTSTFNQVANGLTASNGMSWRWNGASSGSSYDVQAYLWNNGKPYSQSQVLTMAAPAALEGLTINAQTQPPAPPGSSINASCGGSQNSMRQANITYNSQNGLQNPQQYQVTVGTSSQGNQVFSTTVTPNNPSAVQSLSTGYVLNQGQTYYIQYAYSTCTNCNTFSPFSPSVSITCNP